MGDRIAFGVAFVFLLLGAILSFALRDSNTSVLAFNGHSLGFVLLFTGAVLLVGGVVASIIPSIGDGKANGSETGSSVGTENLRAITGLVAVVAALTAVGALTVVTVTVLKAEENKDSIVAVTTSAFGIVSAVVTAFLGIKASANTSAKSDEKAERATYAQTRAEIVQESHDALVAAVDEELPEDKANAVKAAALGRRSRSDEPNPPVQDG